MMMQKYVLPLVLIPCISEDKGKVNIYKSSTIEDYKSHIATHQYVEIKI